MTIDPKTFRATWKYPTQVRFGPGRIAELPRALQRIGIARPLLVTDPGLAASQMVDSSVAACTEAGLGIEVFSEIKPNPTGCNVEAGLEAYRAGGHDGVVAFGGGSALDAGKVIAFMTAQSRPMFDFDERGGWKQAETEGLAPLVTVPTTAGTGAEVADAGVITDESDRTKKIVFHPKMIARLVICDPELTLGLPADLTAYTGMDALAHCLEGLCAPAFHPMSEGIALEGLRLIRDWLPRAVADGSDLEARSYMMAAALMGCVAFEKGLGAVHALSHPIGARYDTHHGLTNAVVLPYVLAFNRDAVTDRLRRLAKHLDLEPAGYDGVLRWLLDLRQQLGIPHTLTELGVGEDGLDELSRQAAADTTGLGNPVPLDESKCRQLFGMALSGQLD